MFPSTGLVGMHASAGYVIRKEILCTARRGAKQSRSTPSAAEKLFTAAI